MSAQGKQMRPKEGHKILGEIRKMTWPYPQNFRVAKYFMAGVGSDNGITTKIEINVVSKDGVPLVSGLSA